MKYLSNKLGTWASLLLFVAYLVLPAPTSTLAQQPECSEAGLQDLGVAIVNCAGDLDPCLAGGVITAAASNNIPEPHKSVIERAASAHSVNPNLVAALFLTEQGNVWKPFSGPYGTSEPGASGPFQFMPGTWSAYGVDGNGDGVIDIQNWEDAAFAAAKLAATGSNQSTPLGDLNRPFEPNTLIYFSATYNWGPGNVQKKTTPSSPITAAPTETQNYMKNIHALISSDFTRSGHPKYGNPRQPGTDSGTTGGIALTTASCVSSGTLTRLATDDPEKARSIILSSANMKWGNYGSATEQKDDIANCLTGGTLLSIATIAQSAATDIPVNALATDHGGCNVFTGSLHNQGRAIDIGYYGNNSQGQDRHVPEGDKLYKFLFDNREILKIDELIWQYPPAGYKCLKDAVVGECGDLYHAAIMNQHYHHIHVGFGFTE